MLSDHLHRSIATLLLVVMFAVSVAPQTVDAARGSHAAPKLLNLYLDWKIEDADLARLSRWDLVVLDMDLAWSFPDRIRELRRVNPDIIILAYVSAGEISAARIQGDKTSPGYKLASRLPESVYMHSKDGTRLEWWPGASLMNATDLGPTVEGKRWADILPEFVEEEMMSTGLWDGVFLDAAYSDITYFFGTDIDLDGDGVSDDPSRVNTAWQNGMRRLLRNMRAAVGSDGLIMVNSSSAYASQVNGVLFENFPQYGWTAPQSEFFRSIGVNISPSLTSFNTNTDNQEDPTNYRLMRYGLTSALLGNGYYSFDAGSRGHARTWWYDEYDAALGAPVGSARRVMGSGSGVTPGVWMRTFEHGIVLVNSGTESERISLPGTFELIHGIQDPEVNTGAIIREIDVPPQDGRIVLRRLDTEDIRDSVVQNGSYLRIFSSEGHQERNGFFLHRDNVSSGAQFINASSNQGEILVQANQGELIVETQKTKRRLYPFGAEYKGELSFGIGNLNRDDALELAVSQREGDSSEIRILSMTGKELSRWTVSSALFRGGVRVAVGDIDGDGTDEVMTGNGPGTGSSLQVWNADGAAHGALFAPFDASERGGVTVAAGDVDGDGTAEILVGSGEGSVPRVRLFDGDSSFIREISVGTQPLLSGVDVGVADVDGDTLAEILVSVPSSF